MWWVKCAGVGADISSIPPVPSWRDFSYKQTLQPFFPPWPIPPYGRRISWSNGWMWEKSLSKFTQAFPLFLFWSHLCKSPDFRSAPSHVVNILIHEGGLPLSSVANARWVSVSNSGKVLGRLWRLHIQVLSSDQILISNKAGIFDLHLSDTLAYPYKGEDSILFGVPQTLTNRIQTALLFKA